MASNASSIPSEMFYHFVKKNQSTDELIRTLYTSPSAETIAHFKAINSHLKNGQVKLGQMVVISPPNSQQCTRFEADLAEAAQLVDLKLATLSSQEKQILTERYQLLNNIASYGGAGYGASLTYFGHHMKSIEATLKLISELYVKTYNSKGDLYSRKFFEQRKTLFARLNMTLNTSVSHAGMGYSPDVTKMKNNLGLSSKSILYQWKTQTSPVVSVPGFEKNLNNVARLSNTLQRAGHIGIALDVGRSGLKIHEACTVGTDKECAKTSFKEGGRLVGSVGGGWGGGFAAAYGTCNLVFGLESFGTSLLWCSIVAGAIGGMVGGRYLGGGGEAIGEEIYNTTLGR